MIDRQRLDDELERMRELILGDDTLRARFDRDGNGTIDGDEWDQVRELVGLRLRRDTVELRSAEKLAEHRGTPPAEERNDEVGRIAAQILERDLISDPGPSARPSSLATASDLVLDRHDDHEPVPRDVAIRRYLILSSNGRSLGRVDQRSDRSLAIVTEDDRRFRLLRGQGPGSDGVEILDDGGSTHGYVHSKGADPCRSYHVVSTVDRGTLAVQCQARHPMTMRVVGPNDVPVGTIERQWSGLGSFLADGNRTRFYLQAGTVTPGQRWGLIAAAVLEDLASEARSDRRLVGTVR